MIFIFFYLFICHFVPVVILLIDLILYERKFRNSKSNATEQNRIKKKYRHEQTISQLMKFLKRM